MITACGAEDRIAQKYAHWVQEAKKQGQFTAPLIALQFGLIVRTPFDSCCPPMLIILRLVLCPLRFLWLVLLVRCQADA